MSDPDNRPRIVFRGVTVLAEWPQQLREAQRRPFCRVGGVLKQRVRYGSETKDWGADRQPCHDCAAIKGELHVVGCDVERCPNCAGQYISCGCNIETLDGMAVV